MDSPFVGQIQLFGFNFAPVGWMMCQGQILNLSQYQALFALLGTAYGGNGTSNFQLPDLRSRVAVGMGQGNGLPDYAMGETGGATAVTLTLNQLPTHSHAATFTPGGGGGGGGSSASGVLKASTGAGTESVAGTNGANAIGSPNFADASLTVTDVNLFAIDANPQGATIAGLTISGGGGSGPSSGTVTIANAGLQQSFDVLSPFLALNYSIALVGLFPSRN